MFGRHPDGIITLTPHEEDNAFVAEATLRNFPPMKPFALRWEYPLLEFAGDLDPKKLRGKPGAKPKYTAAGVLDCLTDGMTTGEWKAAAIEQLGLAASTFAKLKGEAAADKRVEQSNDGWFRKRKVCVFNPLNAGN